MATTKDDAQSALWTLKGMVAEADPDTREKVEAAAAEVRGVLAKFGGEGMVAVSIIMAEIVLENAG